MDERPAPLITISDPTRPGEPVDVMANGDEREPWRPQRRHWTALGVLVLLALAAVVPDRVVSARAEDARAERAAVDRASVVISQGPDEPSADQVVVAVTNSGPSEVQLVEVQVDGAEPFRVDTRVAAGQSEPLALRDLAPCGEHLLSPGDETRARVRLRTAGGTLVTRRVVVPGAVWLPLNALAQQRCDYLPAHEALVITPRVTRVGDALELRLAVSNRGRLPVRVGYLNLPFGMSWTSPSDLPVTLAARTTEPRELVFRVQIDSCADLISGGGVEQLAGLGAEAVLSDGSPALVTQDAELAQEVVQQGLQRLVSDRCEG